MSSPSAQISAEPPFYVLISHSVPLPSTAGLSTTFSHPTIEYHYADDSPHNLLPRAPEEHVMVLDYDPADPSGPTAQSLSPHLAVKGVKVGDAPGASTTSEDGPVNNKIYVVETSTSPLESTEGDNVQSARAILTEFKQRNTVIRNILDYSGSSTLVVNGQHCTPSPPLFSPSHS